MKFPLMNKHFKPKSVTPTSEKTDLKRREVLFTGMKVFGLIATGKLLEACSNGVKIDMNEPFTKVNDKPIVLKDHSTETYQGLIFELKAITYLPDLITEPPLALFRVTKGDLTGDGGIHPGEEKIIYSKQGGPVGKIKCYEINIRSDYDRDIKFDLYKAN